MITQINKFRLKEVLNSAQRKYFYNEYNQTGKKSY